jgi:glycosyltransferase involved in cell wall biosynthesis
MSFDWPKISVITPSYNQASFIERTIQSVLDQDYPNLEYLVIDGGSTDGTVEILRKYDKHLHWLSEKDSGQSDAINKGFRNASGEILAFLNSDDCYELGALRRVGEYFATHPDAHWVTGKCRIINNQGRETRKLITFYKNLWLRAKSFKVLLVLDYVSQPATFWRRTVIEKIGLFDENEHFSMDYDYSLRVGQHFSLQVLDTYLAAFRVHPASKSRLVREHFDTDFAIAKRYTRSRILRGLHWLHNVLIVSVYRIQSKHGEK